MENLHSAIDLGQVTVGDHLRRLIADTNFETSGAPIDELNRSLCLEGSNSAVNIVGNHIPTVEQAGSHVFSITRITFDHLVVGLEARHGDLLNRVGLVLCFGCRYNWRVGDEREVDTRIRDEVGLEFGKIDIEGTVEAEGSSD